MIKLTDKFKEINMNLSRLENKIPAYCYNNDSYSPKK